MNTAALLEEFVSYLEEKGLSDGTQTMYRGLAKGYLDFLAAQGKEPSQAAEKDVRVYVEGRRSAGVAGSSLSSIAVAVRKFHRFLVECGHASVDPAARAYPSWERKWTSKIYIIVEDDGLPGGLYRTFYRTPETPLGILERLGASKGRVVELDVKSGRICTAKVEEGEHGQFHNETEGGQRQDA